MLAIQARMGELLVDSNVLLRFLTNEPPDLADRAALLLGTAEAVLSLDRRMQRIPGIRLIERPAQLVE